MNLIFLHHSEAGSVTGVDVVIRAFMRALHASSSGYTCKYMSYCEFSESEGIKLVLEDSHQDTQVVVASNPHIDFGFDMAHRVMKSLGENNVITLVLIHDYSLENQQALTQILRDSNSKLLATGEYIFDLLKSSGFDSERIGLGIDITRISNGYSLQNVEQFRDQSLPVIMSSGRTVHRKGFKQLVDAYQRANISRFANLYLQLVDCPGKTPDYTDSCFEGIIKPLRWVDSKRYVVHRNIQSSVNYGVASLYVCASSYEGFSMTPIEAAYCGVPPLMSDIHPHRLIARELFGDGGEQFLFQSDDIDMLSNRLYQEITTKHLSTYLRKRLVPIRRCIEEKYSLESVAKTLSKTAKKYVEKEDGETAREYRARFKRVGG